MKKKRVVVAMSGGVDSSVAAALLKEQGYEVIGITMCFNMDAPTRSRPGCCGLEAIEDAARVAHKLDIRHYVLNMHKALKDYVIKNFCEEYLKGRTPNPCVRCNQYLKFGILLKKAISLGAEFLGTGHYARIYKSKVKSQKSKVYSLRKAADKFKDQSYFLYRLSQPQLKRILFPIGDYTKEQVRILAKKFSLPVADKVGSQDICFLPSGDYRTFLAGKFPEGFKPGLIMDKEGNILGQHKGIALYTIGQRQGLRIAKGYPLYIIKIDPKTNQITVGNKAQAQKKEFLVKKVHYICGPLKKKIAAKVKIRYNHKEAEAEVMPLGPKAKVHFRKPQFAITSGQSAVFYSQDKVLGGGIIEKVLD